MEIVLFKSEEHKDLPTVADFLRQLADKLTQNEVTLRRGNDEVNLTLPDQVVLEIKVEEEAKGGGTKYSLEVEIEWVEGEAGTEGGVTLG